MKKSLKLMSNFLIFIWWWGKIGDEFKNVLVEKWIKNYDCKSVFGYVFVEKSWENWWKLRVFWIFQWVKDMIAVGFWNEFGIIWYGEYYGEDWFWELNLENGWNNFWLNLREAMFVFTIFIAQSTIFIGFQWNWCQSIRN